MNKRVILGMSGGVDSCVACHLLLEEGYEVIGVTMNLVPKGHLYDEEKGCCSLSSVMDAKIVAEAMGVKHYTMSFREEFDRKVIENFVREYSLGYTPNPCVACNKYIKFNSFVEKIKPLKADFISTGHYAKVEFDKNYNRYLLKRAKDSKKDQTYFLYNTSQEVLSKTLFPLADLEKEEVRQIAKDENILTYSKKDSEEICFVQNRDHGLFIRQRNPELIKEGYFIDERGNKLGKHNGIVYYTVGQRKGLGIALGKRVFVSKINAIDNTVTLSDEDALYKDKIKIREENFIPFDTLEKPLEVSVKVRHGQNETKGLLFYKNNELFVEFEKQVRAPNKGQSAVFYLDDIVVGGGIIDEVY
ncbi:tRNA 2-thiouridine(34) synthase MnmA [Parvimonas micra]|uniref:tRNA 2-thiouridine(34) synthase MnmA n=1 Tax=Parvimonas micra TaxID=33033 RepID=UPI002005E1DD|nr:tRNA 2-thiouridine(34) synthase MnmA [Parvimonas micra]MCK6130416.1 tRNA 2-thiouridine(34) synthase MnmA [Parvimonas micra]MCK6136063.1 tRNA 2-thiouridine(34) synthase MnmA [Parvimonas micra]MCK6137534.1 tRNA 2-thiouridine(34) synthase MnmA [Parvimonas micra]MCK6154062.1 tRNA 2-thiouridine(34) synthase MnmA [Parvimonas micra]MEB3060033.1 tRNA 2-thiouridine(34) synthase MnmA [Parvimonas micra]